MKNTREMTLSEVRDWLHYGEFYCDGCYGIRQRWEHRCSGEPCSCQNCKELRKYQEDIKGKV